METTLEGGSEDIDVESDIENKTSAAISTCEMGEEAICRSGDNVHPVPASIMTCDKHQMEIKYYCKTETTTWCEKCKMTSGQTCELADIKSYAQKSRPKLNLKAAQDSLDRIEISFQELERTKSSNKTTLQTSVHGCIEEVRRMRKDFNDILDKLEAEFIKQIKDLENKLIKDIDEHILMAKGTLQEVQEKISELKQCKQSEDLAAMFVGTKKSENKIMEFERIQKALINDPRNIYVQYTPSKSITSALKELESFGRIESIVPVRSKATQSLFDIAISDIKHHNVGCSKVQSVIFMPSGHTVMACSDDGLILLDKEFKQSSKLKLDAKSACMVSDTEILVSHEITNAIQFVEVLPNMVAKTAKKIERSPLGICYHNGEIYMTCKDKDSNKGEIQVLNSHGELKRRLGIRDGKYIFNLPWDVKVNREGDRVFVTDLDNNTLTCLDQSSQLIFRYSSKDLQTPEGILLDGQDNVLVCGKKSNNVHIIDKEGTRHQIVLQKKDGIKKPICIAYRHSDGSMAVGVDVNAGSLSLVTLKTREISGITGQLRKNLQSALLPALSSQSVHPMKN